MLPNPKNSGTTIAKVLGVSVGTLYNHILDLQELCRRRVPCQLEVSTPATQAATPPDVSPCLPAMGDAL
jgi:hypothetical protein